MPQTVSPSCYYAMALYQLQDYLYFDVPKHTPVIIAESGDCGTTLVRFLAGDAGGNHETRQLNNSCPVWAMDIVCQVSNALYLNIYSYSD